MSFAFSYPPFIIRHPPSAIRHPPSAIRHPPSAIRHPPSAISAIRSSFYRDAALEYSVGQRFNSKTVQTAEQKMRTNISTALLLIPLPYAPECFLLKVEKAN
ncbi:hypothetical protein ACROYT_G043464 [Oculina patagonica]